MRVIEKVKRSFWDDIAGSCSYATFFHTPNWSNLMVETFPYIDTTKGFVFDDGTRVVFPFLLRKGNPLRGFLNDYVSGYPHYYGGPIADGELNQEKYSEMFEYINAVFKNYSRILIRGNPYTKTYTANGFQKIPDLSHVTELVKCEDEEGLFKSYGKRYRSYVRKALKSNILTIKQAKTEVDYEKLYEIYQKLKKHWDGSLTSYPLKLFRNLYNINCNHIKLWTVYYNDIMIGGDIALYWKDKCYMWLPYHEREHSKLHARRYLLHHVFLDCKERGINYYDFLQSGGIKSQQDFKRSMGGKEYPHCAWIKENVYVKFAKKVRDAKRNLW